MTFYPTAAHWWVSLLFPGEDGWDGSMVSDDNPFPHVRLWRFRR